MKKKLSLNKITVSNLNNKDLSKAHGGATYTCETAPCNCQFTEQGDKCWTRACDPSGPPPQTADCPDTQYSYCHTGCNC